VGGGGRTPSERCEGLGRGPPVSGRRRRGRIGRWPGPSELRDLFLKVDNFMGGRYFAELVKGVFAEMERDAFTFAENRISIYGKHPDEWRRLAVWSATPPSREGGGNTPPPPPWTPPPGTPPLDRCVRPGGGVDRRVPSAWVGESVPFEESRQNELTVSVMATPSFRFDSHGMYHNHNRWMIQIPRTYASLHQSGAVKSFGELLNNIFAPLWEVRPLLERGEEGGGGPQWHRTGGHSEG